MDAQVVAQPVIGWLVCGLSGVTVSETTYVRLLVVVFVKMNCGFWEVALVLLPYETGDPPAGTVMFQANWICKGVPLQLGGVEVFTAFTVNGAQPCSGLRVKLHVGGGMTQTVSV
jgi:hypothetical protein